MNRILRGPLKFPDNGWMQDEPAAIHGGWAALAGTAPLHRTGLQRGWPALPLSLSLSHTHAPTITLTLILTLPQTLSLSHAHSHFLTHDSTALHTIREHQNLQEQRRRTAPAFNEVGPHDSGFLAEFIGI